MPNVKISAAADAGSLLSSDMLPLARSGDTNAYHATMAEIATYASVSVSSGAYGNVGRNLLHNALFTIAQRGTGPFTAQGYTLDRWEHLVSSDTISVAQVAISDAQRAAIGDEAAVNEYDNTFTGNAAAGAYNFACQRIENLRRLSGKTVTVSFWAWCATGTLSLGVSIDQVMGTGGSPSANVLGTGQAQTITTTPARYSKTLTVPSSAGLTLGTNGDHCTQLNIWYSSGTTNASRAGSIGVQSGHIALWGVQLEIGSVATPLAKPDPEQDLAMCQRFFQLGNAYLDAYNTGTSAIGYGIMFPVPMRAVPTIALGGQSYTNASAAAVIGSTSYGFVFSATVTATGAASASAGWTASADL